MLNLATTASTTGVPKGAKKHIYHQCDLCAKEHAKLAEESKDRNASKTKIRNELKWKKPEFFNYVVDKTICLVKGMSSESFDDLSEGKKEELRSVHDPSRTSRDSNRDILQKIESAREDYRLGFFEKLAGKLMDGANRTLGQRSSPGMVESSRASGSADLPTPSRPIGASTTPAMHRTVELLEVSNLDAEKREKVQEMEMCDDDEELKSLEARVAEIDERKKVLKEIIRENDRKARDLENKKQSESSDLSVLDQSWRDARYHAAIKAGVSHSKAWFEEKKRRKAALHRKSGSKERAEEKLNLEKKWREEFDSKPVKEEEFRDEAASGIETEAVI